MLKAALAIALRAQQNIEKMLQGNKAAVVSTTAPRKGPSIKELAMKSRQQFHDKKAKKTVTTSSSPVHYGKLRLASTLKT